MPENIGDAGNALLQSMFRVGHNTYAAAPMARPANTTAYAAGQAVAQNTVAGSCSPIHVQLVDVDDDQTLPILSGAIARVRVRKSGTGTSGAAFRIHFFNQAPTVLSGDGAAFSVAHTGYIGSADVNFAGTATPTMGQVFTDGAYAVGLPNVGTELEGTPLERAQNVYCLIQAQGTYTPVSAETFTVEIEVRR